MLYGGPGRTAFEASRRLAARWFESRTRRSRVQAALVVMYHELAEEAGNPRQDLVPPLAATQFRAQLEHLARHFEVVPLEELIARMVGRAPGSRLPVSLTFDDDLSSHVSIAAPILAELGTPATFFLTGSSLTAPFQFWWQDLQSIVDHGGLERLRARLSADWPWATIEADIHALARTIENAPPVRRDELAQRLRQLNSTTEPDKGISAEDVRLLVAGGFDIGFHTLHHYALPALDSEQLETALTLGLSELAAAASTQPTAIAYPHCWADLRVAEAARAAGFQIGLTCMNEPVDPTKPALLLGRVDGWSATVGDFALRLSRAAARATQAQ